jgi:hypothetical protein
MNETLTTEKGRQGQSGMGVRYVLGMSLFLAVAVFAIIGFVAV